ncbi:MULTISPECIES: SDR family NAD(P)-dependent oxidoreductase [Pseudomonas]|uniref:SDR family NAD(P)-dependent oxidoreductase n=1 Tax=Pseudomonas TaxID=286 RepID=UPI0023617B60|nr:MULTISPECIES: SDR family oxidoreductase [Pseudomonas]WJV25640.1 SDR family oxidoreductase [Pseudomonas chlororaphis]
MKSYLVTGAANGIGRSIALALAEPGDTAILNDLSFSYELESLVQELEKKGLEVRVALGDVSAPGTVKRAFGGLRKLDVLVNNAGILNEAPIAQMAFEQWDMMIRVHLYGTFLFSQEAARLMTNQRQGAIINIASDLGQLGCANLCHYSAAKGGVIAFTKALARELAPKGVRVNAVAPGATLTPMVERLGAAYIDEEAARYPLQRLGTAEEIANSVVFLSSEKASFTTGQVLGVNGGGVMNG